MRAREYERKLAPPPPLPLLVAVVFVSVAVARVVKTGSRALAGRWQRSCSGSSQQLGSRLDVNGARSFLFVRRLRLPFRRLDALKFLRSSTHNFFFLLLLVVAGFGRSLTRRVVDFARVWQDVKKFCAPPLVFSKTRALANRRLINDGGFNGARRRRSTIAAANDARPPAAASQINKRAAGFANERKKLHRKSLRSFHRSFFFFATRSLTFATTIRAAF